MDVVTLAVHEVDRGLREGRAGSHLHAGLAVRGRVCGPAHVCVPAGGLRRARAEVAPCDLGRFLCVVSSLSRDYLPSSWDYYKPTAVDLLTLLGSFGLFFTLFLLFVRFLPMIGMAEVKSVMPQAHLDRDEHMGQGDYHGEIVYQHVSFGRPWTRR